MSLPKSAWMLKPRSKTTEDGSPPVGGLIGSAVGGMFGSLRNNIAANSWNKRYVSMDATAIHYGKSIGQREKSIPLETVKGAVACTREEMKSQKAPEQHLDCGWKLLVVGRDISFCCEDEGTRNEWVHCVEQLMVTMGGTETSSVVTAKNHEAHDEDHQHQQQYYGTTTAQMIARAQDAERERMSQRSVAQGNDDSNGAGVGGADDEDDDTMSMSPLANNTKSQTELRRLVGDDDDDVDFENILADDELDDEDMSDDDAAGAADDGEEGERRAPLVSKDDAYHTFLMPVAQKPYSHIHYKIQQYASHFDKDDSIANVLFSREVDKVAKKDNTHKRDLVVTTKNIYLFAKGRLFTGLQVRTISLDQLVGVVESTIESNLVALVCPAFHDVLIRITPQKSLLPGNEVEVKHQLIAHLYFAHKKLNTGRQFLFREAENVRAVIRRDEAQEHQPLVSQPGDKLSCASKAGLYPVFRINADSFVIWSSFVTRLNAERVPSRRVFVVADSAFYFTTDDFKRVQRRTPLAEISKILYDVDLQGILIKCVEVDALFTVKDSTEFAQVRQALQDACDAVGHAVRVLSSRQLFSNAQLVETRKLREMFGDNAEGLKKGMKFTQRLLKKSWKVSLQSVGFVTNSVAKVGEASVDLLRQAGKEVGGVLVDNQLTGELLNVLSATGIHNVAKIVFETLIHYSDEEDLLAGAEPYMDQLRLAASPNIAEHKLGTIAYSSRCGLFNLTATIDHNKTEDRLVVVTHTGIHVFHPPDAAFSLFSPIRGIVAQLSKGLKSDTKIEWASVTGVLRCSQDDNVVGIQTTNSRHTDVMVRLPNASLMAKFVSVCAALYARNAGGKKYQRAMLNVFSAPKMDNVRASLKKTIFDAPPTIALRNTATTGDTLMLSVVPDIADTLRRYGDNTLYFSGLAWRLRSASMKKGATAVGQMLKSDDTKGDNKLFKSFLLVLTNCAVYHVTKGGYEIARRTDIRDITKVMTSKDDPNALVLVVPTEYDIFFRIEGRGQEFLDRLQEAYATWTRFGLRLAKNLHQTQTPAEFFVPIVVVDDVASVGKLEKPVHFNEEQANRSAAEAKMQYHQFHINQLMIAMGMLEKATDAASRSMISQPDDVPGYDAGAAVTPTFSQILVGLENAVALLHFTQERAYCFGLRAATCPAMALAQQALLKWADATAVAEDLQRAIAEEDISRYEERYEDLTNYPAFSALLKEQSSVFAVLRSKKETLTRITAMLEDASVPLASKIGALEVAFDDAVRANVRPQTIEQLRQQADLRYQREALSATLATLAAEGDLAALPTTTKYLLRDAALQLNIDKKTLESTFGAASVRKGSVMTDVSIDSGKSFDRPRMKAAALALRRAVDLGDTKLLADAVTRAKHLLKLADQERASLRAGTLAAFEELSVEMEQAAHELRVLERNEDVLRDLAQLRQHLRHHKSKAVDVSEVAAFVTEVEGQLKLLDTMEKRLTQTEETRSARVLNVTRSIVAMQQTKLREKLEIAKEELRLGRREAQALADARETQRQREEAERLRLEEELRSEEEAAHNRRMEFIHMWTLRSQKLTVAIRNAITGNEVAMVKQCIRNCIVFQGDVKTGYQAQFAAAITREVAKTGGEVKEAAYTAQLDDIMKKLATAAKVGQRYLDAVEPSQSHDDGAVADASSEGAANVPHELKALLQSGTTHEIVQFMQCRQGTLNRATVAEVRHLWAEAKAKRQWATKLHKAIHTAFSLNNANLLQEQIDIAKAAKYMDDHVSGAIEILKLLREEEARQAACVSEATPAKSAGTQAEDEHSPEVEARPPPVAAVVKQLVSRWDGHPQGSAGGVIQSLHQALTQLCRLSTHTAGIESASKIRPVSPDSSEVKNVVHAWVQLLQHRVKPSGLFRKVDRSVQDVLMYIGNVSRSGDIVAPYTNRLCSDFDRVKKFNNPNGNTSSHVLVMYLLLRSHLRVVLSEFQRVGAKDLGDLFFEDSVFRNPACQDELQILVDMTEQFEWPFVIHERSTVSTSISIARSTENAIEQSRGGSSFSHSPRASDGDPAASAERRREDSALRSITMLRLAVQALSTFFASQLKAIGTSPSQEATMRILDERASKEIGIVVREQLCPALMSIMLSGYRSYHLLSKRRLWDVLAELGERLRESSRALGGVGLPDAIDMVSSITDRNGRNKTILNRMDDDQVSDVRVRMLICHCLNQSMLTPLFESIFDESNSEFLKKYYAVERAMMVPFSGEYSQQVMKIVRLLSLMPFALSIDAEIW